MRSAAPHKAEAECGCISGQGRQPTAGAGSGDDLEGHRLKPSRSFPARTLRVCQALWALPISGMKVCENAGSGDERSSFVSFEPRLSSENHISICCSVTRIRPFSGRGLGRRLFQKGGLPSVPPALPPHLFSFRRLTASTFAFYNRQVKRRKKKFRLQEAFDD